MSVDLDTAAKALSTSREMLLRWVRQGVIPVKERDGRYLFEQKALEQWARRRQMPLHLERVDEKKPEGAPQGVESALRRGGVHFGIRGADVEGVLRNAVAAATLPESMDRGELLKRLLERETMTSTGIGYGVAIPHPRQPMDHVPAEGIINICFLEAPIDYSAVDGKPVSALFILLSSGTRRHLEMLARLTFCLHDPSFIPNLKECDDEADFLSLMQRLDARFQESR